MIRYEALMEQAKLTVKNKFSNNYPIINLYKKSESLEAKVDFSIAIYGKPKSSDGFKEVMSKVQSAHPLANLSRFT